MQPFKFLQGNGTEEVVACSWDGQTYIVNLNREVVRFQFGDNVAAFCAGNQCVYLLKMCDRYMWRKLSDLTIVMLNCLTHLLHNNDQK